MPGEREIFHCLQARQFNRPLLEELCRLADVLRDAAQSKAGMEFLATVLNDKRAILYFAQPSTRTFLSFTSACQILGMSCADIRDLRNTSREKGESEEDTVTTFSLLFDLIIVRHFDPHFPARAVQSLKGGGRPVPVINAGSGKEEHPTQALTDIYTMKKIFQGRGGIDGKKVAFVGDLLRGRTVRSLTVLLTRFSGVKIFFVAPRELQVGTDIREMLQEEGVPFELEDNLEKVISEADVIYMTRLQDEWDALEGVTRSIDLGSFALTVERLKFLKPGAALLHPLPRRGEIPPEIDKDPRAFYWQQVENGMWIRAALIAYIFNRHTDILEGRPGFGGKGGLL